MFFHLSHTAAAEGAVLSVWYYDELKGEDKKKPAPELAVYKVFNDHPDRQVERYTHCHNRPSSV